MSFVRLEEGSMKNLRLVFNNADGEKRDITLPMENGSEIGGMNVILYRKMVRYLPLRNWMEKIFWIIFQTMPTRLKISPINICGMVSTMIFTAMSKQEK